MDAGQPTHVLLACDGTKSNVKLHLCHADVFMLKLLFNLHWLKLFACWSYQRSRGVADPTFPRNLGTGARTSATCTAASSRSSGVGGFHSAVDLGHLFGHESWVMWREKIHMKIQNHIYKTLRHTVPYRLCCPWREIPCEAIWRLCCHFGDTWYT